MIENIHTIYIFMKNVLNNKEFYAWMKFSYVYIGYLL